jgi:hypothetical protein
VKNVLSSFVIYRYQISVSRGIANISEDFEEQLTEELRNKRFPIQTDEMTDFSGIGHLIAYVLSVHDTAINDDMLLL